MGMAEFLSSAQIALGLNDYAQAIITIIVITVLVFVRPFNYIVNRVDAKDDKQFEMLYKIIDDENFLERLSNQPFLIKQLFYKRFYLLKDYKVEEIEFLMSQKSLKISLYEISTLKSGSIIKFQNGKYIKNINSLTNYWIRHHRRFNTFIIIGFLCWILISLFFFLILFKSTTLFYISIAPLFLLEIYLLIKIDGVRAYLRTKNVIDDFIHQSALFEDNQGNRNT
ncbi:hypothetical protein I6E84_09120 [Psychrobacter sp. SCQQ22]|uniref:hypothetical protein n=1 Tax=Psychrobacter sp. SCQQ22 TaxID=2792059 RepID=UPI0018CF5F58|nr:hypothetical protein [Psychrobacter sp. SCQQ22]MBH0086376.1 hypothetical protein [Psychrobacter sp. SCQQ22]